MFKAPGLVSSLPGSIGVAGAALFAASLCLASGGSALCLEICIYSLASMDLVVTVFIDWMGLMFGSFILAISSSVLLFSAGYMANDSFKNRFTLLILLFIFSMCLMVFTLNLVSILLGWDGLGVVSYILVIYYQNKKSDAAGMVTALTNRLGDAALLIAIASLAESGSWNIMFAAQPMEQGSGPLTLGLVTLASMTKSAQLPFSAWLPAAMAAPTPVSALVHSSTLVTAGVYLMVRFSPLMESFNGMLILAPLAAATSAMASLSALLETDLKKIIALSTLSQLGLMMLAIALHQPSLCFFHLLTHAVFKAMMFICGGMLLRMGGGGQDIRAMGSLSQSAPLISAFLHLANLALCGFPFLAGFYSKDLLAETIMMSGTNTAIASLLVSSAGLSTAYSARLSVLLLLAPPANAALSHSGHTVSPEDLPLWVLGAAALTSGAFTSWSIQAAPTAVCLPALLKHSLIVAMVVSMLLGTLIATNPTSQTGLLNFLTDMWFAPQSSGAASLEIMTALSQPHTSAEQGWFEWAGGQGASTLALYVSSLSLFQRLAPVLLFQATLASLLLLTISVLL